MTNFSNFDIIKIKGRKHSELDRRRQVNGQHHQPWEGWGPLS